VFTNDLIEQFPAVLLLEGTLREHSTELCYEILKQNQPQTAEFGRVKWCHNLL